MKGRGRGKRGANEERGKGGETKVKGRERGKRLANEEREKGEMGKGKNRGFVEFYFWRYN